MLTIGGSMKRLILLSFVVAVLILGAAFAPTARANAQSGQCFGLSTEDCALANSAMQPATLAKLTSFNMAYELTLSASGPKGNSFDLSVKGDGPFSWDATA